MAEIMSFHDATRVVSRGSRGIEILQGRKNLGRPRKRLEMAEIMSFDDATRVMSRTPALIIRLKGVPYAPTVARLRLRCRHSGN